MRHRGIISHLGCHFEIAMTYDPLDPSSLFLLSGALLKIIIRFGAKRGIMIVEYYAIREKLK